MALKTLKPRVQAMAASRVPTLEAKAGTTPRIRGSKWMKVRREVLIAGQFACVDCGHVSTSNEIDHDTPLEQGGSNDASNLRVRCVECHKAKTAAEARRRA